MTTWWFNTFRSRRQTLFHLWKCKFREEKKYFTPRVHQTKTPTRKHSKSKQQEMTTRFCRVFVIFTSRNDLLSLTSLQHRMANKSINTSQSTKLFWILQLKTNQFRGKTFTALSLETENKCFNLTAAVEATQKVTTNLSLQFTTAAVFSLSGLLLQK